MQSEIPEIWKDSLDKTRCHQEDDQRLLQLALHLLPLSVTLSFVNPHAITGQLELRRATFWKRQKEWASKPSTDCIVYGGFRQTSIGALGCHGKVIPCPSRPTWQKTSRLLH
ncbi:hypothetical protein HYQ46_013044 [Verticillium longisporum]|nr:hypothetical protein HYQ46_013044 [Verticillium longisporum]